MRRAAERRERYRAGGGWPLSALLALVLVQLLSACGTSSPRPDLRRLYAYDGMATAVQRPVIVIPGILGSRLRDRGSHADVWPPLTIWSLLFDRQQQLELKFDPVSLEVLPDNVEAYDVFEGALGQDFYGEIIRTLEHSGNYERGVPGQKVDAGRRRYYVFAYDWRQDNVVTARKLDALIEQIRRDYADPALQVDVVAHSMGGLITRYFLRYGTEDVLDRDDYAVTLAGASKLHTVVLLGTPNLGSVTSVHRLQAGWTLGLRRIAAETLATLPSLYQLFPHPLNTWAIGSDGAPVDLDAFDPALWQRNHWAVFAPKMSDAMTGRGENAEALQRFFAKQLERARRFVWALTVPEPQTPVRLVVFGGDCTLTPARLLVEDDGEGGRALRLMPDQVRQRRDGVDYVERMLEPGDGVVTKASLLARQDLNPTAPGSNSIFFPLAYSVFLCERHEQLTGNLNFQDNLLNVLLSGERPWSQPQRMDEAPMGMQAAPR